MVKLIGIKIKNRGEQRKVLDLPNLSDDMMEMAEQLVDCNPSKYSKKKEAFRAELLQMKETYNMKSIELLDEELDFAAGGKAEEKEHMKQIIPRNEI